MSSQEATKRRRLWFSPVPTFGLRCVARKVRVGWLVVYRDYSGHVSRLWELYLGDSYVERDAND